MHDEPLRFLCGADVPWTVRRTLRPNLIRLLCRRVALDRSGIARERPMALQTFNLVVANGMRFLLRLDRDDQAQRDVLAHFSNGQMYEHETSLLFLKAIRPGDTVIDVGGNAGYFTMLAATLTGAQGIVVTAEANQRLAGMIREAVRMNGIDHVRVEELAISDRHGRVVFGSNGDHDSNGGIVLGKNPGDPLLSNETVNQFVALSEPLDSLAARHQLERVRLVKIDTEGHELHVLRGASGLLAKGRIDFIACEMNFPGLAQHGTDQHALRNFALDHGYHTFQLDPDGNLPRLIPPGVTLDQPYTCNVLLARLDTLADSWPVFVNVPAAIRIPHQS